MNLPHFRYHPDPLRTGIIQPSDEECVCCEQARGYIYIGPVSCVEDLDECLCPWCIADGSAHEQFEAEFTDPDEVGATHRGWDAVPLEVIQEVVQRTPGFIGWQQEQWWSHCGDAAEFHGAAGHDEALAAGKDFLDALREDTGIESDEEWDEYLSALSLEHGPTAYLFRCRHCGKFGGYSDTD